MSVCVFISFRELFVFKEMLFVGEKWEFHPWRLPLVINLSACACWLKNLACAAKLNLRIQSHGWRNTNGSVASHHAVTEMSLQSRSFSAESHFEPWFSHWNVTPDYRRSKTTCCMCVRTCVCVCVCTCAGVFVCHVSLKAFCVSLVKIFVMMIFFRRREEPVTLSTL